ncbi:MAG: TetR/AcrR family transcriptional regulator [Clostridiaceae bacterium]
MIENKRQMQKRTTRNKLIEVAMKHFGENGIITSKTADIAKAAEVSHGTLFSHFPTQEELLIAVIEEFGNRISKRLHQLIDKKSNLKEVLEAHIIGISEFEEFYTRLIIERRLLPKKVTETYIMIQSTISFHIGIAAEKEIEQGYIKEMPVHLIFNTWISLIHYYLTNGDLFSAQGFVLKNYSEVLLNHYKNLIKK